PSLPLHFLRTTPTPPTTPPFPYTTLFRSRARGFKGMKMKVGRNPSTQTHLRELIGNAEFCEVEPSEDLARVAAVREALGPKGKRSEEHTSELQSLAYLVCRLLLEKKKQEA